MRRPTRRQLLGALPFALSLPVVDDTDGPEPDTETRSGDYGSAKTTVESGDPVFGAIHFNEVVDDEAHTSISAYSYVDEPDQVECRIGVSGTAVTLSFDPDRARELAAELEAAADAAESGEGL
jgi:hypothetical protein